MSADTNLLSLFLQSRNTFDRFESTVPDHLLEEETRMLLADLRVWYNEHPGLHSVEDSQVWELWEWMKLTRHAAVNPERLKLLKRLLGLSMKAKGTAKAAEILKMLTLRNHASRIAEKADRYAAGDTSVDLYEELYDDLEKARKEAGIHDDHDHEVRTSFEHILDKLTDLSNGLHWRSPTLNMALGPIRKGNFGVLAAFVDTGKSTMLASEVTFMATQLTGDEKVLYFNNEEEGEVVKSRLLRSAIGWTLEQCNADRKGATEKYREVMNGDLDRIVLIDSPRISTGMVRRKLRQYNAQLMVFDQLYKVKGFKQHGDDKLGKLQDIFEYGRGLAKEHCPVIAVHQADGTSENVQWITMSHLAGSRQAIQGEADYIITIGRDDQTENARYIHTPKNKLPTPGAPHLRNIKEEVFPNFDIARFDQ